VHDRAVAAVERRQQVRPRQAFAERGERRQVGLGDVVDLGRVAVGVQPGAELDDEVLVGLAGRVERRDPDQRARRFAQSAR